MRLCQGADIGSGMKVVHNYGHGGSGVTLSWGCAGEVVYFYSCISVFLNLIFCISLHKLWWLGLPSSGGVLGRLPILISFYMCHLYCIYVLLSQVVRLVERILSDMAANAS